MNGEKGMFTMSSYSGDSDRKEVLEKQGRQQKALQGTLDLLQSWQRKGVSAARARESIGHMLAAVKTKMADKLDPSQVNLGDLFAQLLKPDQFNREEKGLIQAVFSEAAKLKKKLDGAQNRKTGGAPKKNRFKRPIEKKYI